MVKAGKASDPKHLETGFPQGSILGPFSYPVYTSPLFHIGRSHQVSMHMYADDTQLYLSAKPGDIKQASTQMQDCLESVRSWMHDNHLKLNESKTEFLVICGKTVRNKICNLSSITIGTESVEVSKVARNIGVLIDDNLSMIDHVSSVSCACYYQLHKISKIRQYLSEEAASNLVRSLVLSKLDYCNSLLYGLPDFLLHRLQLVQNNAARLIFRKKKSDNVTPLLMQLHWLPVKQRILFNVHLLTFKSLNNLAPTYISKLVQEYEPTYTPFLIYELAL